MCMATRGYGRGSSKASTNWYWYLSDAARPFYIQALTRAFHPSHTSEDTLTSLYTFIVDSYASYFRPGESLLSLSDSSGDGSTFLLPLNNGQWPLVSWNLRARKPRITAIQYTLYEMTEPYVAELVQPRIALKKPQPPPPFSSGLQH
jgi:hypothetical protein